MKNIDFLKELNVEKMIRFKENSWNGKDYINLENFLTENIDVINYLTDLPIYWKTESCMRQCWR